MKRLKNLKIEVLFLPLLLVAFLFTRLHNIMGLPIFTDEAIYTRWAQIAGQDSAQRFISLTDGKQPSFVWVHMIFLNIVEDPLLAGRLVSVLAGAITVIGIYFLTHEILRNLDHPKTKRIISVIAVAVIVFYPFSIVYDRMALYDSMVAMFFVWALYLQIRLVRELRLDLAMILGLVLGGAVLTKSSGFLSIYLTPFLLLLLTFDKKDIKERLIKFIYLFSISIVMAIGIYSILRLSPYFHIIEQKNSIFVYSFREWFNFPFEIKISNFISNANGLLNWYVDYFSIPYILLVIYSLFVYIKISREKIILLLWFFLPLLGLTFFGKTLYPRYILFMTMPLIPLIAISLYSIFEKIKNKYLSVAILLIILFPSIRAINFILFDFSKAPIAKPDINQYINDWPAGGGVKESVEFFRSESQKGPLLIVTEGTFGLMPYAYEIYLVNSPNIKIEGLWPIKEQIPEDLMEKSELMPVYVVFYQPCPNCTGNGDAPESWPLTEILRIKKGDGDSYLTVYKVNSL